MCALQMLGTCCLCIQEQIARTNHHTYSLPLLYPHLRPLVSTLIQVHIHYLQGLTTSLRATACALLTPHLLHPLTYNQLQLLHALNLPFFLSLSRTLCLLTHSCHMNSTSLCPTNLLALFHIRLSMRQMDHVIAASAWPPTRLAVMLPFSCALSANASSTTLKCGCVSLLALTPSAALSTLLCVHMHASARTRDMRPFAINAITLSLPLMSLCACFCAVITHTYT